MNKIIDLSKLSLIAVICLFAAACADDDQQDVPVLLGDDAPPVVSSTDSNDEQAPDTFRAKFVTTAGDFVIEVQREWSPNGADRFYSLVKNGFYDDCAFFRVIEGFMVQFGIGATPDKNVGWNEIPDDKVVKSNIRKYVTFAKTGMPNSRTTQIFINYADNSRLDADGFSPFGEVVSGMEAVDAINSEYGGDPSALQQQIKAQGNSILKPSYPNLDYVKTATIVETPAE